MIFGFPRAKQGLCHYDIWGGRDPSLIRYSSKTTEQNFMKLSGIVHYMKPYCTSYLKFLSCVILGFPRAKQGLCHTKHGGAGGIILWALLTVFLVLYGFDFFFNKHAGPETIIMEVLLWMNDHHRLIISLKNCRLISIVYKSSYV